MSEIREIFENVLDIHDVNCLKEVEAASRVETYNKGDICILQGDVQREVPFIVKGSFWGYYIDGEGKRYTDCVTDFYGCPVTATAELEGFAKPSEVTFEALEDSTAVLLQTETVVRIVMTYQEVAEAMSRMIGIGFSYHRRFQMMNAMPLQKRYETFCDFFPMLSARLSKTSIAACLNASLPALSRALSASDDN